MSGDQFSLTTNAHESTRMERTSSCQIRIPPDGEPRAFSAKRFHYPDIRVHSGLFVVSVCTGGVVCKGKLGGEFADAGEGLGEAVLAGGGEMARETERAERIGRAGGDFGGRRLAEEIAEQRQQAFHERRIGVALETTAPVAQPTQDPGLGDATPHPVRVGAFSRGESRQPPGAVHHQRHPFLRVVDESELVDKSLKFVWERHEKGSVSIFWLKSSRRWPL